MSYFATLDEMEEGALKGELDLRRKLRRKGVCDYCRRTPDTKPCKFPDRHKDPRIRRNQ